LLFTANDLLLSNVEKVVALRDIVGFDELSAEALTAIAALATRRHYPPGAILVHAGERRSAMHLLVEGDLHATRMGRVWPHPERLVLDVFWLARDTMPLEIKTDGGATVLEIPLDGLDEILEEHFGVWLASAQAMAAWLMSGPAPSGELHAVRRDGDPRALSQRIAAFQDALPFARGFVDALMQLDEEAIVVRFEPGKVVWRPGDPSDYMLVPVVGELRGVAPDEPCGIGGLELLANHARTTRVQATQPLVALRIGREALLDIVEDHHELARDLLAAIAASVVERIDDGAPLQVESGIVAR
jgi:CRP-like cAMP-binding protein